MIFAFSAPSATEIAVSVIFISLSLLYLLWINVIRAYLESRDPFQGKIPIAPNSHWFWGHGRTIIRNDKDWLAGLERFFNDYSNEYGQTGYWFVNQHAVSVVNWMDAKTVLLKEHTHITPPYPARRLAKLVIGRQSILTLNGREWKSHRTPLTKAFMMKTSLINAKEDIVRTVDDLVESIKEKLAQMKSDDNNIELNINAVMQMITLDVFGRAAFGSNFGCCQSLKLVSAAKAFDFLTNDLTRRFQQPLNPFNIFYRIPTSLNQRFRRERHVLRSYIRNILKERKSRGNDQKEDLLDHLQKAHNSTLGKFNDNEADEYFTDILITLLAAGYETTSITLTYALTLLSQNPDIECNCLEEIQSVLSAPSDGGSGILDDANSLVYCWAVILETLRLYPPALFTVRQLEKPIELSGGFVAPAGTIVHIPIIVIHRNERNFPSPKDFRPDRWVTQQPGDDGRKQWVDRRFCESNSNNTDGTKTSANAIPAGNHDAMFTFSAGGRNCVGEKFAVQEAVLVLANLLKELKFVFPQKESGYSTELPIKMTRRLALQKPQDEVKMKIEIRSK